MPRIISRHPLKAPTSPASIDGPETEAFLDVLCRHFYITREELFSHRRDILFARGRSVFIKWLFINGFNNKRISEFLHRNHGAISMNQSNFPDDIYHVPVFHRIYRNIVSDYNHQPADLPPVEYILEVIAKTLRMPADQLLRRTNPEYLPDCFVLTLGLLNIYCPLQLVMRTVGIYPRRFTSTLIVRFSRTKGLKEQYNEINNILIKTL